MYSWYQEEGKEAIPLKPGMIITIPIMLSIGMELKMILGLVI